MRNAFLGIGEDRPSGLPPLVLARRTRSLKRVRRRRSLYLAHVLATFNDETI